LSTISGPSLPKKTGRSACKDRHWAARQSEWQVIPQLP
jgi:hypothetical protein